MKRKQKKYIFKKIRTVKIEGFSKLKKGFEYFFTGFTRKKTISFKTLQL
jgi:hypothetical protein